jgi:hypothetical protein
MKMIVYAGRTALPDMSGSIPLISVVSLEKAVRISLLDGVGEFPSGSQLLMLRVGELIYRISIIKITSALDLCLEQA